MFECDDVGGIDGDDGVRCLYMVVLEVFICVVCVLLVLATMVMMQFTIVILLCVRGGAVLFCDACNNDCGEMMMMHCFVCMLM